MARFRYTDQHRAFIAKAYKDKPLSEVTRLFNEHFGLQKSFQEIKACTETHRIRSGRTGYFEPGQNPWNKGTQGQRLTGPNCGSFKKGNIPPNRKPLWDERICTKDGYILMKVPEANPYTGAKTRYKAKHVWLWEQANGTTPKGHILRFIDGNRLNCTLENIECITMAENAVLNKARFSSYPVELRPTIRLQVQIAMKRSERAKD